jgi:hypothetical protein
VESVCHCLRSHFNHSTRQVLRVRGSGDRRRLCDVRARHVPPGYFAGKVRIDKDLSTKLNESNALKSRCCCKEKAPKVGSEPLAFDLCSKYSMAERYIVPFIFSGKSLVLSYLVSKIQLFCLTRDLLVFFAIRGLKRRLLGCAWIGSPTCVGSSRLLFGQLWHA